MSTIEPAPKKRASGKRKTPASKAPRGKKAKPQGEEEGAEKEDEEMAEAAAGVWSEGMGHAWPGQTAACVSE